MDHLREGIYEITTGEDSLFVVAAKEGLFVEVGPTSTLEMLDIPLAVAGVVRGQVIDGVGRQPISGATVEILTRRNLGLGNARTRTNALGAYEFAGLTPAIYELALWADPERKDSKTNKRRVVQVGFGSVVENVNFLVPHTIPIEGRVETAIGKSVANAYVFGRRTGKAPLQATTLEDGTFKLTGAKVGEKIAVGASHGNLVAGPVQDVVAGETKGIVLALVEGGRIEGSVKRRDGSPAQRAWVYLSSETGSKRENISYRPDGQFRLAGLQPGDYHVGVGEDGPVYDVTVQADRVAPHLYIVVDEKYASPNRPRAERPKVPRTSTLSGQVTSFRGQPIPGVMIKISQGGTRHAMTGLDGRFTFRGLLDAKCRVFEVHKESFLRLNRRAKKDFEVGTTDANFQLDRMGTVSGKVIDGETGKPITNFEVALHLTSDENALGKFAHYTKWMGSGMPGGEFQAAFERDKPYPTTLVVRASGYRTATLDVGVVGPNTETNGVEVSLESGGRVQGQVISSDSTPIAGAEIYPGLIDSIEWMDYIEPATVSDSIGRYEIESLPEGESFLTARHARYSILRTNVTVRKEPVTEFDITMLAGAAVGGRVTQGGAPMINADVGFKVPGELEQRYSTTDDNGRFELEGLPPGEIRLKVKGHVDNLLLTDGDDLSLDIELPETTSRIQGKVSMDREPIATTSVSCRVTLDTEFGPYEVFAWTRDASYILKGVPAGSGELTFSAHLNGERVTKSVAIEIGMDEVVELNVDLTAPSDGE